VAAAAPAAQAVLAWVRGGIEVCMNRFNGPGDDKKEKPAKKEPKKKDPDAGPKTDG
jgi:hypothetical protein